MLLDNIINNEIKNYSTQSFNCQWNKNIKKTFFRCSWIIILSSVALNFAMVGVTEASPLIAPSLPVAPPPPKSQIRMIKNTMKGVFAQIVGGIKLKPVTKKRENTKEKEEDIPALTRRFRAQLDEKGDLIKKSSLNHADDNGNVDDSNNTATNEAVKDVLKTHSKEAKTLRVFFAAMQQNKIKEEEWDKEQERKRKKNEEYHKQKEAQWAKADEETAKIVKQREKKHQEDLKAVIGANKVNIQTGSTGTDTAENDNYQRLHKENIELLKKFAALEEQVSSENRTSPEDQRWHDEKSKLSSRIRELEEQVSSENKISSEAPKFNNENAGLLNKITELEEPVSSDNKTSSEAPKLNDENTGLLNKITVLEEQVSSENRTSSEAPKLNDENLRLLSRIRELEEQVSSENKISSEAPKLNDENTGLLNKITELEEPVKTNSDNTAKSDEVLMDNGELNKQQDNNTDNIIVDSLNTDPKSNNNISFYNPNNITKEENIAPIIPDCESIMKFALDGVEDRFNTLNLHRNDFSIAVLAAGDEDEKMVYKNIWAVGSYGVSKYRGKNMAANWYNGKTYAATIGGDVELTNGSIIGLAYSYVDSHFNYKNNSNNIDAKTHVISLYGQNNLTERLLLQGLFSVGFGNLHIKSPTQGIITKGKSRNTFYSGQVLLSQKEQLSKKLFLIPHIGIKYGGYNNNGYTQDFVAQSLSVAGSRNYRFSGVAGVEVVAPIQATKRTTIIPKLHVSGEKFLNKKQQIVIAKIKSNSTVSEKKLLAEKPAKYLYKVGGGVTIKGRCAEFTVSYDYLASDKKYSSHQGSIKLKLAL